MVDNVTESAQTTLFESSESSSVTSSVMFLSPSTQRSLASENVDYSLIYFFG